METLAVLLLAVTFSAITPFVMCFGFCIEQRRESLGIPRLDRSHRVVPLLEVLRCVLTLLALAVDSTELAQSETVAVEFEAFCVAASAEELAIRSGFEVGVAAVLAVAVVELGEVDGLQVGWTVLVCDHRVAIISASQTGLQVSPSGEGVLVRVFLEKVAKHRVCQNLRVVLIWRVEDALIVA